MRVLNILIMTLKKLLTEGYWESYYRKISDKNPKEDEWHKLVVPSRYWCADPFIVSSDGKKWIFCEILDRKISRGLIGCGELNENGDTEITPILNVGCHTSYPDVFNYKGIWFMIPETVERRTIELYKASDFPYKWEKCNILSENINAVDTTVFEANGRLFVFVYEQNDVENKLSIAELNMDTLKLGNLHQVMQYNQNIGRPGGRVFYKNSKQIRPTQYGITLYGGSLIMKEFSFNPNTFEYKEKDIEHTSAGDILPDCLSKDKIGFHTYNVCEDYEIVDVFKRKVYISRFVTLFLKKFRLFGYRFRH